jgi:hypothetical protein
LACHVLHDEVKMMGLRFAPTRPTRAGFKPWNGKQTRRRATIVARTDIIVNSLITVKFFPGFFEQ